MIEWFEDNYDPDELVDVLGITVEEIVNAFQEKAERHYELSREGEEEDTE